MIDARLVERYRVAAASTRAVLDEMSTRLRVGMSELEAAKELKSLAFERGARGVFHAPVVLFGDRTALQGAGPDGAEGEAPLSRLALLPTGRTLADDEPVILDCAPLWDGVPGDVSTTVAFGEVPGLEELQQALGELREAILRGVVAGQTKRQLVQEIDSFAHERGLRSCRHAYAGGAAGHRIPGVGPAFLRHGELVGLGLVTAGYLTLTTLLGKLGMRESWPFWSDGRAADTPPSVGLWSVEPHLARGNVGAKWEDVLVRDVDEVRWIADGS